MTALTVGDLRRLLASQDAAALPDHTPVRVMPARPAPGAPEAYVVTEVAVEALEIDDLADEQGPYDAPTHLRVDVREEQPQDQGELYERAPR